MHTYQTILYLHFLSLLLGFGAGTIIWICLFQLRAAQTLADAAPWGALAGKIEKVFPAAVVGLFATGAYMTSDRWTWGTRWIDVSIAGLAVVAVQGGGVAAKRAHLLKHALMENGPGELGEQARRMTRDRALWIASFTNPAVVLGIVWDMTQKPGVAGSIAALAIAYAVGAALAMRFTRAAAPDAKAATEPA